MGLNKEKKSHEQFIKSMNLKHKCSNVSAVKGPPLRWTSVLLVVRYILYVLRGSRASSSAPIYKVDSFKTKRGKVRHRKNGVKWALDGDGWFYFVIFHRPDRLCITESERDL